MAVYVAVVGVLTTGVFGCATDSAEVAAPAEVEHTPSWVREVPNEPGQRLYAVALLSGGDSTQDVLDKARDNLLDKAFKTTYRAEQLQRSGRGRSPALMRSALTSVTDYAPRVISERYHDPKSGQPVIAAMVALDFRLWHTAIYGFPPRAGDGLTHALLSAHARLGDRPFRPDSDEIDEVTAPVDDENTVPQPGTPTPNGEGEEEPAPTVQDDTEEEQTGGEPQWTLSRPPGQVRVIVVALSEVRDTRLSGWPSAAPDGRLLADAWSEYSLVVYGDEQEEDGVEFEPDLQPRLLSGAQASRDRIMAELEAAASEASAVVFIYVGVTRTTEAGELVLLTVDSERERLARTALPAHWLAQLAESSALPGVVLLDGAAPAEGVEALGWPTLWPSEPGHEPYVDQLRGHGLVSYFATRALEMSRADVDKDGRTTMAEWLTYIRRNVAAASRHRGREQRPWLAEAPQFPRIGIIPVE